MVKICPDIPDEWIGGRTATAKVLGIDPKTLDKYASRGPEKGGIGHLKSVNSRKRFCGNEIKRFWRDY